MSHACRGPSILRKLAIFAQPDRIAAQINGPDKAFHAAATSSLALETTMKIATLIAAVAFASNCIVPALAQVPRSNATIEGTQGPNANGTGYPSAAVQAGQVGTTNTTSNLTSAPMAVPSTVPSPGNVAAGQPTMGTANGMGQTPGTPK